MGCAVPIERLRAICASADFDYACLRPALAARVQLLAEHTETVADSERMVANAERVLGHYATKKSGQSFTDAERRIVLLGCLFSDIGKTGPARADSNGQSLIAEMFAVEGVRDDKQPVREFLAKYFVSDAQERLERFEALGLDPEMSIRSFWNLHSTWTLELAEAGGLPPEVIAAVATHHLLDDVNPEAIVADDDRFVRSFGENTRFDRAEKLIILLDKYDAARRRGRLSHEQAIGWLRERVARNPRFRGDAEFTTLIADLETALAG